MSKANPTRGTKYHQTAAHMRDVHGITYDRELLAARLAVPVDATVPVPRTLLADIYVDMSIMAARTGAEARRERLRQIRALLET